MTIVQTDNTETKFCTVKFQDLHVLSLIDTGAQISLISESIFKKIDSSLVLEKHKPEIILRGVTGHELKTIKRVFIKFKIGTKLLTHEFHVVKNLNKSIILGIDFLNSHKAKLDFSKRTLAIGKQIVLLKTQSEMEKSACTIVYVKRKRTIAPMSVAFIELGVRKQIKGSFVLVPLDNSPVLRDQPGVMVPNTVVKGSNSIIVPLLNETGRSLTLKAGEGFGILEPLDETDISCVDSMSQDNESGCTATNHPDNSSDVDYSKVPLESQDAFRDLLQDYAHLFAKSDLELGCTNVVKMSLNTGNSAPIKQRPYRLPFSQRPILDKHLDELLEAGIIRPSKSPWSSPIIMVPRKDGGSPRMCVDYRKLNKVLVHNSFPLPNINDILTSMHGAKVFSCIDLKSGYYQIEMEEADKEKTAFITHRSLFEFNRLPFGLASAPPIFQHLIQNVIGSAQNVYAIAYLDYIIVYSKTYEEHLTHLRDIFERLDKANLKMKPSKCNFFEERVKYLGHVISGNGIEPDPEKVQAIEQLQPPTTVKEVRSIVGMASYYRAFIPNFSELIRPLTELTRKNARFEWSLERQKAFDLVKQKLTSAPVLAHPDMSKPFKLHTDASIQAVGAVLTQDYYEGERVVQYLSKQLTGGQQKWPTIEREAYAIIFAINKLRHFLLGHNFTVFTDHKPLRSLFTAEMKNVRVQRWAIMLEEYGCHIEYKKGKLNVPADMLSRISKDVNPSKTMDIQVLDIADYDANVIDSNSPDFAQDDGTESDTSCDGLNDYTEVENISTPNQISQMQRKEAVLSNIIESLEGDEDAYPQYIIQDGLLYHISTPIKKDQTQRLQLVIPEVLKNDVLEQMHISLYGGGHASYDKMFHKLRFRYFWENMYRDVVQHVDSCAYCKSRKLRKRTRPLQDMPTPDFPMQIVGIDLVGPYPEAEDASKYVVTIVDHFSGWPEAYPIPDKTANTVASVLLEKFIPTHGCPSFLVSDRGTEFINSVIGTLLKRMKICHLRTTPFHPQSNGKTERFHRYMNDVLSKYAGLVQTSWITYIPALLMAYRTSVNDSTKFTPFFLLYGRDPVLPMDTLLRPKLKYMGDEYLPTMLQRLHLAYVEAKHHLAGAREKNKQRVAAKAEMSDFQPGDAVFYLDKTLKAGESQKLNLPWKPFYRVVEQLSPVTYRIKNQLTGKAKVVHAENLHFALPEHTWDAPREEYERHDEEFFDAEDSVEAPPLRRQPLRAAKLANYYGVRDRTRRTDHPSTTASTEEKDFPPRLSLKRARHGSITDLQSSSEDEMEVAVSLPSSHARPIKRVHDAMDEDLGDDQVPKRQKYIDTVNAFVNTGSSVLAMLNKPFNTILKRYFP